MKYNISKCPKVSYAGKNLAKQLVKAGILRGGGYGVSPRKKKGHLDVLPGGCYNEPCEGGGYCGLVKLNGRLYQIVNGGGYCRPVKLNGRIYQIANGGGYKKAVAAIKNHKKS